MTYWVNVYKNNRLGLFHQSELIANVFKQSLLINFINGGKPLYRIKVKLK